MINMKSLVQELMRVMYTDPDTSCLKDVSNTPGEQQHTKQSVMEWCSLRVPFLVNGYIPDFYYNDQHIIMIT